MVLSDEGDVSRRMGKEESPYMDSQENFFKDVGELEKAAFSREIVWNLTFVNVDETGAPYLNGNNQHRGMSELGKE